MNVDARGAVDAIRFGVGGQELHHDAVDAMDVRQWRGARFVGMAETHRPEEVVVVREMGGRVFGEELGVDDGLAEGSEVEGGVGVVHASEEAEREHEKWKHGHGHVVELFGEVIGREGCIREFLGTADPHSEEPDDAMVV